MADGRPLIGITGRRIIGSLLADCYEPMKVLAADLHWANYSESVAAAGGIPVLLSESIPAAEVLDRLDGVVLTGGTDIDPAVYGEDPDPALLPPDEGRDTYEMALLDAVADRATPTLGICRGIQMMNVHAGGTLVQHIPEHTHMDLPADAETHDVSFAEGTTLHGLYGPTRKVNSLHHQGLERLADAFAPAATSADGLIEGIEHTELPMIAVQWHPEAMRSSASDPIFRWLVDAARPA